MTSTLVGLGALSFLAAFANGVLGAGNAIIFIPVALYGLPVVGVRRRCARRRCVPRWRRAAWRPRPDGPRWSAAVGGRICG